MALNKEQKKKIVEQYDANLINTGSNKVQFNLLTADIEILSYHIGRQRGLNFVLFNQ
ncbi:hypothetical protein [Candidatus Phytoplasma bonamiae]|uniref:30S ribosomal protein S15 n=1 Tax=Candidatus Phytoplasma bonamiae TaxID=2982626 RepID=A0ABT9D3L0_9MOLU|nr:hypothetical protein ['Bonamia sp.' little leaf phytoplasma]MDO8063984.1 hypothetical protein ['Bonamia sp.' little leaf phytoplasma]MDV3174497.1 hypothetical protein ['Bonamia sp.' little leaf phytoplasma]